MVFVVIVKLDGFGRNVGDCVGENSEKYDDGAKFKYNDVEATT